ncbi:MAG TPA: DUF5103 domain-containing protein [Bacteroidales bacterium]|nr:DUF5103 domain-containing protein [Bacteroidales bacterium]
MTIFLSPAIQDDQGVFRNEVLDGRLRTVQLYREGWNLSYPILKLNSDEKLELHFDLLSDHSEDYYYTIIHCDKDWKQSDIFLNDYLDGLEENPIEEYKPSFNTTVKYYHYRLPIPNDRIRLKVSGNYIVMVYPAGQKEKPVLYQRFIISEDAVKLSATVHRPLMTKNSNTHQQIDFTVSYGGMNLYDPFRNVYASILQNGRWDNAKTNLKPDFFGNNELKFNTLSDKNIFPGGNEFRYFDIKSIRYKSEFVRMIDFASPNYNVYLEPSENREFKPYFYWKDFNGKFYIAYQEGKNPDTDADYVYVYFTLPASEEEKGGKMYVSGALNGWRFDKNNEMAYNTAKRQYECAMLLKQGWYNYEYAFLKDGTFDGSPGLFEGNHYETENDYIILVYYRNPRERFDRVLGNTITNTLNKIAD